MINLKQYRTCNGCRLAGSKLNCTVGYHNKPIQSGFGIPLSAKPMEPCPKAKTVSDSLDAIKNYNKSVTYGKRDKA